MGGEKEVSGGEYLYDTLGIDLKEHRERWRSVVSLPASLPEWSIQALGALHFRLMYKAGTGAWLWAMRR